jgi:hypothetical protein
VPARLKHRPRGTPTALLYDPATDTWSEANTTAWPAFFSWQFAYTPGAFATPADGKLLIFGPGPGFADARGAIHDSTAHALFDSSTATWTSLPPLLNRSSPAVVVSAHVLTWGGRDIFTDLDAGIQCSGGTACDPVTPTQQSALGDGLVIGL